MAQVLVKQAIQNRYHSYDLFIEPHHKNIKNIPDSKVPMAIMGPTWVLSAPGGPHICPINLAIRDNTEEWYLGDMAYMVPIMLTSRLGSLRIHIIIIIIAWVILLANIADQCGHLSLMGVNWLVYCCSVICPLFLSCILHPWNNKVLFVCGYLILANLAIFVRTAFHAPVTCLWKCIKASYESPINSL